MREGRSASQQWRGSIQVIVLCSPPAHLPSHHHHHHHSAAAAFEKMTLMRLKGQPEREWTGEGVGWWLGGLHKILTSLILSNLTTVSTVTINSTDADQLPIDAGMQCTFCFPPRVF